MYHHIPGSGMPLPRPASAASSAESTHSIPMSSMSAPAHHHQIYQPHPVSVPTTPTPLNKDLLAPPPTPTAVTPVPTPSAVGPAAPMAPVLSQPYFVYPPSSFCSGENLFYPQPQHISGPMPPSMYRAWQAAAPMKPIAQFSADGTYFFPPDAPHIRASFDPYAAKFEDLPESVQKVAALTAPYYKEVFTRPANANESILAGCPTMLQERRMSANGKMMEMEGSRLNALHEQTQQAHMQTMPTVTQLQAMGQEMGNDSTRMTDAEMEDAMRERKRQEAFKTSLCDMWRKGQPCSYGEECRFAHGEAELRYPPRPRGQLHPKYKTQLCDKFSLKGSCPYGSRCQFIHRMIKGLSVAEYNQRLAKGQISPARDGEIVNADEDWGTHKRNYDSMRHSSCNMTANSRTVFEKLRDRAEEVSPLNPRMKTYLPEMGVIKIEESHNETRTSRYARPQGGSVRRRLSTVHSNSNQNGHSRPSGPNRKDSYERKNSSSVPIHMLEKKSSVSESVFGKGYDRTQQKKLSDDLSTDRMCSDLDKLRMINEEVKQQQQMINNGMQDGGMNGHDLVMKFRSKEALKLKTKENCCASARPVEVVNDDEEEYWL